MEKRCGPPTPFSKIYNRFLGKITDDQFFQDDPSCWTKEDTIADLYNILMDALPGFEFPRFPLYDYSEVDKMEPDEIINLDTTTDPHGEIVLLDLELDEERKKEMQFNTHLTSEEINILALLMYNTWLQRQIASIEQTRMKYSGTDFKLTSQANHLAKLIELKKEAERQTHHMQRLYKRRKIVGDRKEKEYKSNWTVLKHSVFDDE